MDNNTKPCMNEARLCGERKRGKHEMPDTGADSSTLTAFALDSHLVALKDKMTPSELVGTISSLDHLLRVLATKLAEKAKSMAPDLNHVDYVEGSDLLNEISDMTFLREAKLVRIDYHDHGITISACEEIPEHVDLPCGLREYLKHEGVLDETICDLLKSNMLIHIS